MVDNILIKIIGFFLWICVFVTFGFFLFYLIEKNNKLIEKIVNFAILLLKIFGAIGLYMGIYLVIELVFIR